MKRNCQKHEKGLVLSEYLEKYLVSPTLLRVVRVFRVSRVLRLVKSAKGIRTLLFSFAVSLPALFNIGLLLFLVIFIYTIFGMGFFRDIKLYVGLIDDVVNFQTFGKGLVTLFPMCTSAGWDGILRGITNQEDCDPKKDCGNHEVGTIFIVSYLVITYLVIINMYIAVILENFTQATEEVQQGLTPEDFDLFFERWEKFDPRATQYIALEELSDFIDFLDEPLKVPKPNHLMLVKMDIPIYEGDLCFCRDILDALTRNFLSGVENIELPAETEISKNKVEYEVVSSTMMRQKEQYAARIIQNAYRLYKLSKKIGDSTEDKVARLTASYRLDLTAANLDLWMSCKHDVTHTEPGFRKSKNVAKWCSTIRH